MVRLVDASGATVAIGDAADPYHDGHGFVDFVVAVSADRLSASTRVRSLEGDNPGSLHQFFRELADDWRGERPERSWEAIEHDLAIDARRDSLGHLYLTFNLRQSYRPDAWRAQVTVQVEAGEEMSSLAAATCRLLSG